jgi:hypothetical protein
MTCLMPVHTNTMINMFVFILQSCCLCCYLFIFSCSTIIHVPCLYAYYIYMIHMFYVLLIHIVMDIFEIVIFMIKHILYVIIIMIIYGIKMIWKMPIFLTGQVWQKQRRKVSKRWLSRLVCPSDSAWYTDDMETGTSQLKNLLPKTVGKYPIMI